MSPNSAASGRTKTAGILFGSEKPDTGSMSMVGTAIQDLSSLGSIKPGTALCLEDRKAAGIVDDLTVGENIVLAMKVSPCWLKYLSLQDQEQYSERYISC